MQELISTRLNNFDNRIKISTKLTYLAIFSEVAFGAFAFAERMPIGQRGVPVVLASQVQTREKHRSRLAGVFEQEITVMILSKVFK